MRRLLLLLIVLAVPSLAWAEDLYYSQGGGGTGASCASPLSAATFNLAANWTTVVPTTGKINPGDTAHLCGTITITLTAGASGTSGNFITIYFEPNAMISLPAPCSNVTACLNISNRSFIIVNGGTNGIIENTTNGSTSSGKPTHSVSIGLYADPCANCEIKNLTIRNIYVAAIQTNQVADLAAASGAPCMILSGSNTSVHHNTLHDCGWAIFHRFRGSVATPDHDVNVYNNEIYHIDHGYAVAGGLVGAAYTDFFFYNNYVHDYANWDLTNCIEPGGCKYHHDGVHAYGSKNLPSDTPPGSDTSHGDRLSIYNNRFLGNCGAVMTAHVYLEGNPTSTWTTTGSAKVFNNVLSCSAGELVSGILNINAGHVEIYGNTVIGSNAANTSICASIAQQTSLPIIKNNVFEGCGVLFTLGSTVSFADSINDVNYNAYVCPASSTRCWNYHGTQLSTFGAWHIACGNCDGSSINPASSGLNAVGVPQTGSAVINKGFNLTNLGITALNSDINGAVRPSTGAWTIGAYNFGSVPVVSYPLVPGLSLSSTYTMTVDGVNVPVQRYQGHSFAWFAFGGTANVVVTVNETVSTYTLSPLRNPTPSTKSGATVNFSLNAPKHLVLHKVNGLAEKLFIFGDAQETSAPNSSGTGIFNIVTGYGADNTGGVNATTAIQNAIDAATAFGAGSVVYVPAGLYTVNAAVILKANVHFYLAPGAVIKNLAGTYSTSLAYHVNGQHNVRMSGRGVLYGNGTTISSYLHLVEVGASSGTIDNFTMQDIMLLDSRSTSIAISNATNPSMTNVKILAGAPALSDGVDTNGVTNATMDHLFILSSDDSFAVTSGQSSFSYNIATNTDGYTIKNSLMYHTSTGHSMAVFAFAAPQYIKNVVFENNDTISTNDGFGFFASNGLVDINHITIRNSRIEEIRRLNVEMWSTDFFTGWGGCPNGYCVEGPNNSGKINNITLDNVIFDTVGPTFGQLSGRTATQNIDTINFNAVYMAGTLATNTTTAHIIIQSFVTNVTYTNNVPAPDVLPPAAPTNVTVQ